MRRVPQQWLLLIVSHPMFQPFLEPALLHTSDTWEACSCVALGLPHTLPGGLPAQLGTAQQRSFQLQRIAAGGEDGLVCGVKHAS